MTVNLYASYMGKMCASQFALLQGKVYPPSIKVSELCRQHKKRGEERQCQLCLRMELLNQVNEHLPSLVGRRITCEVEVQSLELLDMALSSQGGHSIGLINTTW